MLCYVNKEVADGADVSGKMRNCGLRKVKCVIKKCGNVCVMLLYSLDCGLCCSLLVDEQFLNVQHMGAAVGLKIEIHEIHQNLRNPVSILI